MKKLYAIILATVMVMALASCNKEQSAAYDLYLQASEAMNQTDSIAMDMTMNMDMSAGGETVPISMVSAVKQVLKSETELEMEMAMMMDLGEQGGQTPMTAYYLDGMYYMDAKGFQYKMAMPMDEALGQAQADVIEFPEDAVLEQKAEKNGDDTTLTFKLSGSALDEALAGQMEAMTEAMQMGLGEMEMTFGDVTLSAVIDKDGNFKNMTMEFSFSMVIQGETIETAVSMTMENFQFGGVTIEFPENLDEYMDFG